MNVERDHYQLLIVIVAIDDHYTLAIIYRNKMILDRGRDWIPIVW